jgi:hypothetical protein
MGDHKLNGQSIAKAARPPVRLGDEHYGFAFSTVIEPNKEFSAEITEHTDRAMAGGEDARRALHDFVTQWNPKDHPERFDIVVYKCIQVARPNPFLPDPRQVPTATLRWSEEVRAPIADVRSRADGAFAEHGGAGNSNPQ